MGIWATLDRKASKCLKKRFLGAWGMCVTAGFGKTWDCQVSTVDPQPAGGASTSLWPSLAGTRQLERRSLTALSAVVTVAWSSCCALDVLTETWTPSAVGDGGGLNFWQVTSPPGFSRLSGPQRQGSCVSTCKCLDTWLKWKKYLSRDHKKDKNFRHCGCSGWNGYQSGNWLLCLGNREFSLFIFNILDGLFSSLSTENEEMMVLQSGSSALLAFQANRDMNFFLLSQRLLKSVSEIVPKFFRCIWSSICF